MFHIVLAIASRFLYFGNALQGFARSILSLRTLGAISSCLIPALSPPPPIALLDASLSLPDVIVPPYPSAGIVALESLERQPPAFASPIPSYQSSLITVSSSQLPIYLPLFVIALAIISGFVVLLSGIIDFFKNVSKSGKFVRSKNFPHLFPAGLLWWPVGLIVSILQRCGLLAVQDTRTPPLLDAVYEQITRSAAGYDNLVDYSDASYTYVQDQAYTSPECHRDNIPESYRLRLQSIYNQFVDSHNCFREQLDRSRIYQKELHAEVLAAERERERLISTLEESEEKRQVSKVIVSNLRADLTAARDLLNRQAKVASTIQSVTEKSQVAHVRLKHAEDKITHLNTKLQAERDRRHRKKKELLDEQARLQDLYESEIRRLKQEVQDAQEQLQQITTPPRNTCQSLPPPESIRDPGTPPVNPTTRNPRHQNICVTSDGLNPSEGTQDHWAALKKLFERARQDEYEDVVQDTVKPNSELQESRLQDELAATKEQLCLAEEEALSTRRELEQSREKIREVVDYVASLQSEWQMFKAKLREAQNARRSTMTDLAEVLECLGVCQAESEKERFRTSQATFLCAALQEQVAELEAEVEKLKYSAALIQVHEQQERDSESIGTVPSDVEVITPELESQDSIYIRIPPLLPRIIDFSLPPSPTTEDSIYLGHQMRPAIVSPTRTDIHSETLSPADAGNTDSFLGDLSLALQSESGVSHHYEVVLHDRQDVQQSKELVRSAVTYGSANPEFTNLGHLVPLLPSPSLEGVSGLPTKLYRSFLSEGNSMDSMGWPPIGSMLSPGRRNIRQDREEDIETEEGTDDPNICDQGPFQESEPVLNTGPVAPISVILDGSEMISPPSIITTPTRLQTHENISVPIRPYSLPNPTVAQSSLLDPATLESVPDRTVPGRLWKDRWRASHRRIPIPKLEYDLPADFVPSSFSSTAPKRQASGIDDFAFFIPLDCRTSTPVAARKEGSCVRLRDSGGRRSFI